MTRTNDKYEIDKDTKKVSEDELVEFFFEHLEPIW